MYKSKKIWGFRSKLICQVLPRTSFGNIIEEVVEKFTGAVEKIGRITIMNELENPIPV